MQLNAPVPDFILPDTKGSMHRLSDHRGSIVVVNFWSAECPWSARADQHLLELVERAAGRVVLLPVASNLNETDEMIDQARQDRGLAFVLQDDGSDLALVWGAQTTPHAFVIDPSGSLVYQGAVDDVTFRKRQPTFFYVQQAVDDLLNGRAPAIQETQPYGCTIVSSL